MSSPDIFRKKTERLNKIAGIVISSGGYGIILVIIAILLFLVYQILPLSYRASILSVFEIDLSSHHPEGKIIGLDQYQEVYYLLDEKGLLHFYSFTDSSFQQTDSLKLPAGEKVLSASKGSLNKDVFAVGTSMGRIITAEVIMSPDYSSGLRKIICSFTVTDQFQAEIYRDSVAAHIEDLVYRQNDDGLQVWVWRNHQEQIKMKIDDGEEGLYDINLSEQLKYEKIQLMTVNYTAEKLMLSSSDKEIFWYNLADPANIILTDSWKASQDRITAMEFLFGNNALVIGDSNGRVRLMFPVRTAQNKIKYSLINEFDPHPAAVSRIRISPRNRTFLTIDQQGGMMLRYATTGATELTFSSADHPVQLAEFSPKSNGIVMLDKQAYMTHFQLHNEHPEATAGALFGQTWYEDYPEPEFVWQSTGGSDEFEPKFSLIPLIFGTLKGTFYAMLFSIPIALLAAIYVSQFSPGWLSRVVKPTVEIMAALPSVVIGFLAGLYFSPVFEKQLMPVFLYIACLPVSIIAAIFVWRMLPEHLRSRAPAGWEVVFILPLLFLNYWFVAWLAGPLEMSWFNGNLAQWLYDALDIKYDQRNSLVVGFALGFAVIPTIFTISEDALSNVPERLTSAALALGASRWQTVKKIVIPAAAGGIFAAIMLGLGRAIGETMIVLMATGNTPILDFSPFNGFRAMSACIAVEIPEAPVGGTLYRILFLTAFLLFVFTFIINSLAAVIGDRLRKKYARF